MELIKVNQTWSAKLELSPIALLLLSNTGGTLLLGLPQIDGNSITFPLDKVGHVTVEVNGDWHESLHVFANPLEEDIPDPDDPNVIYIGPGIHRVTTLVVGDNTTVYIAGGAVVQCVKEPDEDLVVIDGRKRNPTILMLQGKNITLRGRGIIEGGTIVSSEDRRHPLEVVDSENVVLEGVTFQNIRVEEARRLISCWIGTTCWTKTLLRHNAGDWGDVCIVTRKK